MIHPNRFGIIDLGTNTFHLLIVDKVGTSFNTIFRKRVYVKLGQGGVDQISEEAFQRGLNSLQLFKSSLENYHCENYKCVGTAALRKSSNAEEFITIVKEQIGLNIEVISGNQEAFYIYKGIESIFPFKENYSLIMDIGGGSIEYIIANKDGIVYSESIPMGIAILKNRFHHSNPMSSFEREDLKAFFLMNTLNFKRHLKEYKPKDLIGSSGTFDVLNEHLNKIIINHSISQIELPSFENFADKILASTTDQLINWEAIPDERVDLISVAIQLIIQTIELAKTKSLFSSKYALKEGIISSNLTDF